MRFISLRWINGFKFCLFTLLIASLYACSDAASQAEKTTTDTKLVSVELSPNNQNQTLALDTQMQLFAVGIFSDNSKRDITKEVSWNSDDIDSAEFGADATSAGIIFAKRSGFISVTASLGKVNSRAINIKISDATLERIEIEPPVPKAVAGTTKALKAVGYFSDNTQQILTDFVIWESSDTNVATINENSILGLVTTINNGTTSISAKMGDVSSTPIIFTVGSAVLSSIKLEPIATTIGLGTHMQFAATGIYTDGTTQNLTNDVVWMSTNVTTNSSVAFISNDQNSKGLSTALSAGKSIVSAKFGGVISDSVELTVTAANLTAINITANAGTPTGTINMAIGTLQRFHATGIYSDLTTQDLTDDVIWVSQYPSIAVIDNAPGNSGLTIPITKGATGISALFHGILSPTLDVNVTDIGLISIDVTPTTISVPNGTSKQFTAIGHFSDGTSQDITQSVTWAVDNRTMHIASISNNQSTSGLATANAIGATSISASLNGVTSNLATFTSTDAVLTAIDISPLDISIDLGTQQNFIAIGTYSDTTTVDITGLVSWQSTAQTVASISNAEGNAGIATSINTGFTQISAIYKELSSNTGLTVTAATLKSINLSPLTTTLQQGESQQFIASGVYTNGLVDITNLATWTSTVPGVASVINGLATAMATGQTDIKVDYNGVSKSSVLKVNPASPTITVINPAGTTSVAVGENLQINATGGTDPYLWSVSNINASINVNTGLLTGQAKGTVTVTATDANGNSGSAIITVTLPPVVLASIDINPKNAQIISGQTIQFSAIGSYSDLTTAAITNTATWTASIPAVLSFSTTTSGEATATAGSTGTVFITSTLQGISTKTQLTVTAPLISVSTTAGQIRAQGNTVPFSAKGGTAPYSWSVQSANPALATIDKNGVLTPLNVGIVTVTAIDKYGFSGSTQINIIVPKLAGLFPDPVLQACINNYAAVNGFTTADQITTLGTFCVGNSTTPKIVSLAGMEYLTNLLSLEINDNAISTITPLSGLTQLAVLVLRSNQLSVFSDLANLTNLFWLDLDYNIFTATTDLSALGYLTNLKVLSLNNAVSVTSPGLTSDATNNTLAPLGTLGVLQTLNLADNKITSLSFLTNLTSLTHLYLANNSISVITELGGLTNLVELLIWSNPITDVSVIGTLSFLQHLDLTYITTIDPIIFASTFGAPNAFKQLNFLGIVSTGINDISVLSNLTSLSTLYAGGNGISDLSPLAGLINLSVLVIDQNAISDITPLGALTKLTNLNLNRNKITDLTALGTLTNLSTLDLGVNTIINQASFSVLSKMSFMSDLKLYSTGIVDVSVLAGLTEMKSLNLNYNSIGGLGVGHVDQLVSMTKANTIMLEGAGYLGISCQELNTLIGALNVGGKTVVIPGAATPGSTCTAP